ncbi:unnamed protein product [Rotaria sordida]|uniref:Berberine/berberine-like domain-containing protein n=1 Tax=Rotaria sordida TaxID=392033 RepID=A0A819CVJ7_9BILA|nr:unnamed protein product [Rotaria sordida]
MHIQQSICFLVLLLLIAESFAWFHHHHHQSRTKRATTNECCVSSKLNVGAKKANSGRNFFRQLATEIDSYKLVNPENMCNLMHFFIQQASLNNKSVSFTKGMFVIFDSTNQIFDRLMKAKEKQKAGDGSKHAGYFKRFKHMGQQAIHSLFKSSKKSNNQTNLIESDTFIYVRGDESSHYHGERGSKWDRTRDYPAYGMDIPGACMPSGFGHILFGELPPIRSEGKYAGERIYIKPEFFGIRQLKHFIKHTQSYLTHVSRKYVCQLKDMQTKPGCSKEDAFRENTDKKLLDKWKKVLMTIPTVWNVDEQYMKNATKYGIGEINRQAKELEAMGHKEKIKEFHETMIKQYGEDELSVRKGREIIFTTKGLLDSPLTCELFIYVQIWLDGTSTEGQQKLAKNVTKQVEILQTMAECPQSDAYINEVDPNEANWQQKFFGPIENYNRLKSVKDIVSLNGLFACKKCVSGDD